MTGLFKQNLNFADQKWVFIPKRLEIWRNFIDEKDATILACGLEVFEYKLFPRANYVGTLGDYNYTTWKPIQSGIYKTVFCFEVLEHLCNPLFFLERMKYFMTKDGLLYISFPSGRPQFLWTNGHFHEYGKERAEKLFEMAGYKVIKSMKSPIIWRPFRDYLKGIRPLLRLIFPLKCRLYKLRLE